MIDDELVGKLASFGCEAITRACEGDMDTLRFEYRGKAHAFGVCGPSSREEANDCLLMQAEHECFSVRIPFSVAETIFADPR